MKRFLLLFNLAMTVLVVYLTVVLLRQRPSGADGGAVAAAEDTERRREERITPARLDLSVAMSETETNVIWQENLFHPARTYQEDETEDDPETPDAPAETEQYILTGIMKWGKRSCASIIVKPIRIARRPSRGRRTPAPPPALPATEKVYAIGDPVGAAGYELVDIHDNHVTLKRDELEKDLLMEPEDEKEAAMRQQRRSQRLSAAAKKAAAAQKARATQQVAANQGRPPAAGGAKGAPAGRPAPPSRKPPPKTRSQPGGTVRVPVGMRIPGRTTSTSGAAAPAGEAGRRTRSVPKSNTIVPGKSNRSGSSSGSNNSNNNNNNSNSSSSGSSAGSANPGISEPAVDAPPPPPPPPT